MQKIETDFYSIKEFAAKVGVHPNTVRRAIQNGRISAANVGSGHRHIYRIAKTEINRIALLDLKEIIDKMVEEKMDAL
jgi:excisionase family DNA binding protein